MTAKVLFTGSNYIYYMNCRPDRRYFQVLPLINHTRLGECINTLHAQDLDGTSYFSSHHTRWGYKTIFMGRSGLKFDMEVLQGPSQNRDPKPINIPFGIVNCDLACSSDWVPFKKILLKYFLAM